MYSEYTLTHISSIKHLGNIGNYMYNEFITNTFVLNPLYM